MDEKQPELVIKPKSISQLIWFWMILVGVALVLIAPTGQSATHSKIDADLDALYSAEDLFTQSGLKTLLQQIPTSTATSFEAALGAGELPDTFDSIDPKHIRIAIRNAFKFETFDRYLVKELKNGMPESSRQKMLSWYATEIGERVKHAELDNSLLFAEDRFAKYQVYLARYPAPHDRLKIIEQLDHTMQSTEAAVDMMTNMQVAFNLSLSRFMPEEMQLSRQEIVAMVNAHQSELMAEYKAQTQEVLLFTYQDLGNDELIELNETLATTAGQQFVAAINNGIKKGMFAASLDLGDGLGALLDSEPDSPGI